MARRPISPAAQSPGCPREARRQARVRQLCIRFPEGCLSGIRRAEITTEPVLLSTASASVQTYPFLTRRGYVTSSDEQRLQTVIRCGRAVCALIA